MRYGSELSPKPANSTEKLHEIGVLLTVAIKRLVIKEIKENSNNREISLDSSSQQSVNAAYNGCGD